MRDQFILPSADEDRVSVADFLSTLYGFLTPSRDIVSLERDMDRPAYEMDSPHINAPNWPWAAAGWTVSGLHVLFFVAAWIQRTA
jgi:hypothetical protein